jgi:hypothetical protein
MMMMMMMMMMSMTMMRQIRQYNSDIIRFVRFAIKYLLLFRLSLYFISSLCQWRSSLGNSISFYIAPS